MLVGLHDHRALGGLGAQHSSGGERVRVQVHPRRGYVGAQLVKLGIEHDHVESRAQEL